jgi:hypothetical protein
MSVLCSRNRGRDRQPGRPPARGTRTIGMCSFDARNRGSTRLPLKMKYEIERLRAVEDQSGPIPEKRMSEFGRELDTHQRALIDSSCKSAVRLRVWEGHGAQ